MSVHTPGPWESSKRANGRWFVGARAPLGGRGSSANLSVLWDVANGKPGHDNTAEGNARLIAAAPDLLAALKAYVEACHAQGLNLGPITGAAEAAIAKAEGRS